MSCVDVPITVLFDKRRKFEKTYTVCPETDISSLADEIASDIARAWARATGREIRESMDRIREGVSAVLDMYLTTAFFEVYGRLEELVSMCEAGLITEESAVGSDGYAEGERALEVVVDVSGTCDTLTRAYYTIMDMIAPAVTREEIEAVKERYPELAEALEVEFPERKARVLYVEDRFYRLLPEPAKRYYDTVSKTRVLYRELKDRLSVLIGANIWYTIYRTTNA
jgi:hypothetical protein